ncbi:MAG TPA: bifunctional transaldolase/phosoglucose isomerase [Anaerolineales bacterium]|nr:bifunctional transaldolase/phosoglucose isomerase [Anaerolineales bacterium]
MNPITRLRELGQSLWIDDIRREWIESGELARWIASGEVRGMTSNPTIFEQAIAGSDLYTPAMRRMAAADWDPGTIFDRLATDDIREATDLFRPVYEGSGGGDGFVSIEVIPDLANDTERTLSEVRRLWTTVNRPNLMIKIPATQAGVPAIEKAISEGINVNVTLIFSLARYAEVMEAYLRGLEARLAQGASIDHVASVASFFVSRVDTAVDGLLEALIREEGSQAERAAALRGKAAVANAKLAYAQFRGVFDSQRFNVLRVQGARVQRPLWASTSTKNPLYSDTYYVDNLIGRDTVDTLPLKTLEAFRGHGVAQPTIEENLSAAISQLQALEALGISMAMVTQRLESEGVEKFRQSYHSLLETIRRRCLPLRGELGPLKGPTLQLLEQLDGDQVGRRLWAGDATLWSDHPSAMQEIRNRLGWLSLPHESLKYHGEWDGLRGKLLAQGFKHMVLLGMGGSSLAADVFRRSFVTEGGLQASILDSTDPAAVRRVTRQAPVESTLYVVSSKSGATTEPIALLEHFMSRAQKRLGTRASEHFVAITDPGTELERLARERDFRAVFLAPPDVGGRYSALTVFGLLPAALMHVDVPAVLHGAGRMARASGPKVAALHNPGLYLGAVLGAAGREGRDRLTLIADEALQPLADWIEQLIAESSGKEGRGLLPVVGELPGSPREYGDDHLIAYLRCDGSADRKARSWVRARLPVVVLDVPATAAGLGAAFFEWEVAAATACHLLQVNAFDQPDVQAAKDRTQKLLERFRSQGRLPALEERWRGDGVAVSGGTGDEKFSSAATLEGVIDVILKQAASRRGLALLLYLAPGPGIQRRMRKVRQRLRTKFGLTTTLGFGPRYLHSTGQFHKGGPDRAVFIVVTADPAQDLPVPGMGVTFGVLERAQAVGDLQALRARDRVAYGLHLDQPGGWKRLAEALEAAAGPV